MQKCASKKLIHHRCDFGVIFSHNSTVLWDYTHSANRIKTKRMAVVRQFWWGWSGNTQLRWALVAACEGIERNLWLCSETPSKCRKSPPQRLPRSRNPHEVAHTTAKLPFVCALMSIWGVFAGIWRFQGRPANDSVFYVESLRLFVRSGRLYLPWNLRFPRIPLICHKRIEQKNGASTCAHAI